MRVGGTVRDLVKVVVFFEPETDSVIVVEFRWREKVDDFVDDEDSVVEFPWRVTVEVFEKGVFVAEELFPKLDSVVSIVSEVVFVVVLRRLVAETAVKKR